ncbi:MAG: hypothetical protein ABH803_02170 [Candidatus Micrarchaeota archaeon]
MKAQWLLLETLPSLLLLSVIVLTATSFEPGFENAYGKALARDFAETSFKNPVTHTALLEWNEVELKETLSYLTKETGFCFKIKHNEKEIQENCGSPRKLFSSKKVFFNKGFFFVYFLVGFN